jgi:hypothetical protein
MPSKDFRKREVKKPKKVAQKIEPVTIMPITPEVEVIGKRRKKREEEGVEEEKG